MRGSEKACGGVPRVGASAVLKPSQGRLGTVNHSRNEKRYDRTEERHLEIENEHL